MRLVGVFLAVVLAASTAHADRSLPFDIVRLLPETNQALIFDKAHNTHVLLQPGSTIGDFQVVSISSLDMVVEKQKERFAVYPHDAQFLTLTLRGLDTGPQPPILYGKSLPAAQATQLADAKPVAAPVAAVAKAPVISKSLDAKKPAATSPSVARPSVASTR